MFNDLTYMCFSYIINLENTTNAFILDQKNYCDLQDLTFPKTVLNNVLNFLALNETIQRKSLQSAFRKKKYTKVCEQLTPIE